MRVIALLASYNERRFIGPCLDHLARHGVDAYLIDNGSTDNTVELAERWLGHGLLGIETLPRGAGDIYDWRSILRRKEELARELEADWFIHMDPDEIRLGLSAGETLAESLEHVDRQGYNAVNFFEFTFLPTVEDPDHDHSDFQSTLRTYYPFEPRPAHQLKAWKATDAIELEHSAGHTARFPDLKMFPDPFPMKHYLFLSVPHATEKYIRRRFSADEVNAGWHTWRSRLRASDIGLPSRDELRTTRTDADLDPSKPRTRHYLAEFAGG